VSPKKGFRLDVVDAPRVTLAKGLVTLTKGLVTLTKGVGLIPECPLRPDVTLTQRAHSHASHTHVGPPFSSPCRGRNDTN